VSDQYKELFDKAMAEINKFWTPAHSIKHYCKPEVLEKLEQLDAEIDEHWGKSMGKFREVLVKYYKLHKGLGDTN